VPIDSTDDQALSEGIDRRSIVRDGLIQLRNAEMANAQWVNVMLLTHAIWWLADDRAPDDEVTTEMHVEQP
jgi:hypothetical protein